MIIPIYDMGTVNVHVSITTDVEVTEGLIHVELETMDKKTGEYKSRCLWEFKGYDELYKEWIVYLTNKLSLLEDKQGKGIYDFLVFVSNMKIKQIQSVIKEWYRKEGQIGTYPINEGLYMWNKSLFHNAR